MERKIKDERYDLKGELPDSEDEIIFSDEFSDPEADLIYKKYKMMNYEAKNDHE